MSIIMNGAKHASRIASVWPPMAVALWLRGRGFARATSLAGGNGAWAVSQVPDMARYRSVNLIYGFYV